MGPPVGKIAAVGEGRIDAVIDSETQRSVAVAELPLDPNPSVKHDGPGVLGLSGPSSFYLTLGENSELDGRFTALGRVVAGAHVLGDFAAGDEIRSIRILRSGESARAFKTDDEAFQRLLRER
jgi:cyclophilin family peptidyl-prolyl cis-trans isomerase